jgi:hypothetical protein
MNGFARPIPVHDHSCIFQVWRLNAAVGLKAYDPDKGGAKPFGAGAEKK